MCVCVCVLQGYVYSSDVQIDKYWSEEISGKPALTKVRV